jgi:hypothetical protein
VPRPLHRPAGKKLVGCDADALELRCLAGYMARYDGGAYIETVLKGTRRTAPTSTPSTPEPSASTR